MVIPTNYTPIQFIVPDDKDCYSIYYRWRNIYLTNKDEHSYISYVSLARTYNLIYSLVKTDNLKLLYYTYTEVPLISAENIEFYKLNKNYELITKEENDIQEVINSSKDQLWYKHDKLHRDNDLPAIIYSNGTQEWFKHDKLHRDNDLPAIIYPDGRQEWYQNNQLHRDNDLPALILPKGSQFWYKNGVQYNYPS